MDGLMPKRISIISTVVMCMVFLFLSCPVGNPALGWPDESEELYQMGVLPASPSTDDSMLLSLSLLSRAESAPGETRQGAEEKGETYEPEGIPDPLERWNRWMFTFNDRFYFWVFRPVAQGYKAALPSGVRVAVKNFFQNVTTPIRFVNALLQAKPKVAVYELSRFLINSSVGLGGFADVASQEPELRIHDEDTGQTLGVYGIDHGFYIVWPILGPSSLRDSFGMLVDGFLNPVNYLPLLSVPQAGVAGIHAYDYLNQGSFVLGEYEDLKKASVDPYIAVRDAYYQRRKHLVEE
jgi:phospholipid-binding lipoprotein MlaA